MAKELRRRDEIDRFDLEDLFLEIEDRGLKLVLLMDEFEYVTQEREIRSRFLCRFTSFGYSLSFILDHSYPQPL